MPTRRDILKTLPATGAAFALSGSLFAEGPAQAQEARQALPGHFHPKGKAPSEHTMRVIEAAKATLPFDDTRDFDEQARGLIAERSERQIMADAGNVAFDRSDYDFLDVPGEFDSIHPSMTRIGRLNNNFGLYEVVPGVYQVRGFDLANITFVRGATGWIAFDVGTVVETARAAWELLQEHVGEGLPITAVIYSHTHADHWGGVGSLVTEEDLTEGRVEVVAPNGFMDFLISENVFAGNAMNRRLFYQYGLLLPSGQHGFVTQGLGHRVPAGVNSLLAPTRLVSEAIEEFEVDGVRMIFQNTPDTEAPREMNTYLPDLKALWMAENVTAVLHNIYTLRGTLVRDALNWSQYINEALYLFGGEAEVMFASHHWPRWGNERVQEVLRDQRDMYAHFNNQVLHYANQGVTINQIHNVYEMPESLQQKWHCRGYHGSPEHNSRGVIQRFLGFWDCNPATLIPLSPEESAPLYVEMMGGAERIMARADALHRAGDYLLEVEILNKLVQAEPENGAAKDMLADCFEQLGYQQENPGLRNSFLAAAYELRSGIPQGAAVESASPDVIRAMSTELFLNFLAIKMDSRRAEGLELKMNLVTPDNDERFVVELSNATLTNIAGYQAEDAELTLTVNRADLETVMAGEATFEALLADGRATADGDIGVLGQLAELMVEFDPRFEIMPGTKARTVRAEMEPFEGDVGSMIAE
ncbi:alkyl/aryl-sulfatase [Dichotomicrobium thermohalophilum]|uniref:Alkyl sulfatase BDS1-like metallo-beta-lactamase superfamily hydrolase n=1 Tax=Dichotomicrobium thermohalophilum TaxID=933063 RepID=A0A397Q2G7_9HYPH|nr:alkyl sulfatase dimerization domain-containing protein [Dichotomicrobium thermohalophilum]RIA55700.1 alkyl sulfatase BDS1-like metallo-beta-lactamase superfamily hydrolase [Dichotomicrobium thermohalophilum]